MQCKACGVENPEEAVFCSACGERLNSETVCPSCKKQVGAEDRYCPYCGEKLKAESKEEVQPPKEENKRCLGSVSSIVGGMVALVGAVLAAIFTCFIGLRLIGADSITGINLPISDASIWEFFGEAYQDAEMILNAMKEYPLNYSFSLYFPIVLGTVISAATVLCSIGFAFVALLGFEMHMTGRGNLPFVKFAVASMVSFLFGALALWAVYYMRVEVIESYTVSLDPTYIGLRPTPAMIAGIVLCGVALAVYFVCKLVSEGKNLFRGDSLFSLVFTLAGLILLSVVTALAVNSSVSMKTSLSVGSQQLTSGARIAIGYSYFVIAFAQSESNEISYTQEITTGTLATIFQVLLVTALIVALFYAATGGNKSKGKWISAVVATALSVGYLVCANLFGSAVEEKFFTGESSSALDCSMPIAVTVICFLYLALTVTGYVLGRKSQKADEPQKELDA